jgi:hypothetical protein
VLWWHCHGVKREREREREGQKRKKEKEKVALPLCDVLCFHFHDEVHKHFLICQAPTPPSGIAHPCHCKWGWRKDQGQRLFMLADCNIASTARRKIISLLYCPTLYVTQKAPVNTKYKQLPSVNIIIITKIKPTFLATTPSKYSGKHNQK